MHFKYTLTHIRIGNMFSSHSNINPRCLNVEIRTTGCLITKHR